MSAPNGMASLFDQAPDFYDAANFFDPAAPKPNNLIAMPAADPAPKRTLREHIDDVETIADTIEALDAEDLDEASRDELSKMLIAAIAGTKAKVDRAAGVLAMFDGLEAAALAERDRLVKRAATFARQRERLETYLLAVLEASKMTKLEGITSTIAVRLNPAAVVIDAGIQLAPAFLRTPPAPAPVPDKTAIKAALQRKEYVPGCRLERSKRLVRS